MVHLVGNVQPPSVNIILFNPVPADFAKIFLYLQIGSVQLWHLAFISKTIVVWNVIRIIGADYGKAKPIEPVCILGLLTVFYHVVKGEKFQLQ